MEIRMVDLRKQYEKIKSEIDEAIQEVINSTAFINGPFVEKFKSNLGTFLDSKFIIPCGNGTDALQLALMSLDLNPGDEVITTPFTFVATAEAIVLMGLKPVFVDVDPLSFNINPDLIEDAITSRTKCIIPVHLFGQSCDMNEIMSIAQKFGLSIIEDAAQAIGSEYDYHEGKRKCGTIGDMGTFSFFPSKNLGCFGDGGAICTDNEVLASKANLYANHGSSRKYYYDDIGTNSRLDSLQAAILDVKLNHLNEFTNARIAAADRYDNLLSEIEEVKVPSRFNDRTHIFHQYTLQLKGDRDAVQAQLKNKGIPSAIYYPASLHSQSIYKKYGSDKKGAYAVTESLCNSVLSLPMHTELNEEMQAFIIDNLKKAIAAC